MSNSSKATLLLRLALTFSFGYTAIASLIAPENWVGFLPIWIKELVDPTLLLTIFSIFELILAIWLLSGKLLFYAAITSAFALFGIIFPNIGAMEIIFRDVSLLLVAVGLALFNYPTKITTPS